MISCKAKPKATVTADNIPTAPVTLIPNILMIKSAKAIYRAILIAPMKKFFADKSAAIPFLMPEALFKIPIKALIKKTPATKTTIAINIR